ncbi:MAG: TPM domain-containing protein [Ottowia sp.]|nr:TPM domain-containing protein [Ottowia sp.]
MSFKRFLLAAVLFAVAAFLAAGRALALDVPPLTAPVNDRAGVLSPEVRTRLNAELLALQRDTGAQIAVLTIPTLEGEELADYALRVASSWGMGKKREDNGALLLVAVQDRKLRIEVGYGLEDKLTDLLSSHIIREAITPAFKRGDYAAGIAQGVAAMQEVVRTGRFTPPQPGAAPAAPGAAAASAPLGAASTQAGADASEGVSGGQAALIVLLCGVAGAFMRLRQLRWWHAWIAGALVGAAVGACIVFFSSGVKGDIILGGALLGWMLAWACFGLLNLLWDFVEAFRTPVSSNSDERDSGPSYSSRSSSSGSSYSGGGGRFGGGGASGSW